MWKRVSILRVLAILAVFAVACQPAAPTAPGGKAPATKSAEPVRISIGIVETLDKQDPFQHTTGFLYGMWCEVLGCLLGYDFAKGEPTPALAESWKVENGTTWTFNLRKDAKWSDGSPFTSADVVYSMQRILDDPQSLQKFRLSEITRFEAVDPNTLRVTTKTPNAELLDATFVYGIAMVNKAQAGDRGEDLTKVSPIGTGPYRLKEWTTGQRVVLEKVPNWWGGPVDGPDEVIYRSIREPAARITALLNNEIQIAQFVPPQDVERVNSSPTASITLGPSITIIFLGLNPGFKPWDNKLVRQAAAYAIDRDTIIKNVLQGYAEKLDGPLGPGQYGYDPNLQPRYTYDPEKAKQLLAQAGYPNGVDVEYTTRVGTYIKDKEASEAMVQMLNAVGIRATLATPEASTYSTLYEGGKLGMYFQGRGSVRDGGGPLAQMFQTGVTKRLDYSNPKVDELFAQQRAAFDPDQRKKILSEIQSIVTEEAPAHFLWRYKIPWGVSKNVELTPLPDDFVQAHQIRVKP
jgi:peptide/nickel transport system substrate-binding protein